MTTSFKNSSAKEAAAAGSPGVSSEGLKPSLSRRIVRSARGLTFDQLTPEVVDKVKIALFDMLSCAFESRDLPFAVQAVELARRAQGKATVIGAPFRSAAREAAFANGTLGHGLVREDMHTGSVSHLGVVIFPTLLALAQHKPANGRDFILAAVCGYEVSAAVGKALMDAETVRIFRPTGVTGPLGGAVAGSLLLGLSEDAAVSALGLAANTTVGLNEWPFAGADEMYFHIGYAARNAVTAVELAELGAFASETALDGRAGLFAALRRPERAAQVVLFSGQPEILSVYHKPAPACNYAQTACQAALALATKDGVKSGEITAIAIKGSSAALNYPGCNCAGPFERVLQAKMSIQYCVAATLARGSIEEANYRMMDDPEIARLLSISTLEEEPAFTAAYPRVQGAEVTVTMRDGRTSCRRLDDLIPATPEQIRARFRSAGEGVLGRKAIDAIETAVDQLERQNDVGALSTLLAANAEKSVVA
jgi:2-methylcitrate dehydratase PrpD